MSESFLKLDVPHYVDDFATDSVLPLNLVADIGMFKVSGIDLKVNVQVGERVSTVKKASAVQKMLLPLPVSPGIDPGECRVVIELVDNGEVVHAVNKKIKTMGTTHLWMDSPTLADSIYVRMNTDTSEPLNDIRSSPIMQYLRPYRSDTLDPSGEDAYNFTENVLDYLNQFDLLPMAETDSNGLIKITGITDALETKKADALTKALIFCYVAWRMNYKPVLLMYKDTCLVGVRVLDYDSPLPLTDVSVNDDILCSPHNFKGKFMLVDMTECESIDDSSKAASMQYNDYDAYATVIVPYEKDKEKYVLDHYYVEGKQ